MHPLLKKALERLGLKSFNDLNDLEKETFRNWEVALSQGANITSEEAVEAIRKLFEDTLDKLGDENLSEKARTFLLSNLKVVKYILRTVESPRAEVKRIESEISQLGKN